MSYPTSLTELCLHSSTVTHTSDVALTQLKISLCQQFTSIYWKNNTGTNLPGSFLPNYSPPTGSATEGC